RISSPPRVRVRARSSRARGREARARRAQLTIALDAAEMREDDRSPMNIRPNRVKQKLAAGGVATILSGTNDPDLIDQLGTLDVDGIWLEGEHGGVDYADLGNLT